MKKTERTFLINDTLTSVVIIINHTEPSLADTIKRIDQFIQKKSRLYEIVCIDNSGNSDEQNPVLDKIQKQDPHVRTITLSKKYSQDIAITVGIDSCIGDFVIFYDPKTDSPEVLQLFLTYLDKGYDVILGNPETQYKKLGILNRFILSLVSSVSQRGYFYRLNYSLALSRRAVLAITRTRRKNRNFAYLNSLIGLKQQIVSYKGLSNQSQNKPHLGLFTILKNVANDVISNSFKPIRWISLLGMLGSSLFLVYILVIVILILVFQMTWIAPQGWISLATVMGALFFLLFSMLTIMSEYLIRIMDETRNEPLYFISQERDNSHRILKNSKKGQKKRLNIMKI